MIFRNETDALNGIAAVSKRYEAGTEENEEEC